MLRNVMMVCLLLVYSHIALLRCHKRKVVYVLPHKVVPTCTQNHQAPSPRLEGLDEMFQFAKSGVEWERHPNVIPPPAPENEPGEPTPTEASSCAIVPAAFDGWAGASAPLI